ncbi:unnamed protein product [Rotaria sp. Silwood1]|nr:unnamed protein product [Rotaria sp. Silwood1]
MISICGQPAAAAAAETEENTDHANIRRKNFYIHGTTTEINEIIAQNRSEIILIKFNLWLEFQKFNFAIIKILLKNYIISQKKERKKHFKMRNMFSFFREQKQLHLQYNR